jgi:cyanophycinase
MRSVRAIRAALILAALALLVPMLSVAQETGGPLVPIGGGYSSETLEGFGSVVAENASGDSVDIYVVPSTYGDSQDPDVREANIELASQRTQQVEDACNVVVVELNCNATLLMLFDRDEAEDPENSDVLYDDDVDGVYILGGNQLTAMEVLADTPAEDALTHAYENGVVIGGTSAGAAVQSQNMIAGYPSAGWPYNALERPMVNIWWVNDDTTLRGLIFGSDEIIWDQHFYQRGRFTRLLNVVAQSNDQFDGASKLGVGIDNATSVTLWDQSFLANVVGETSVAIIDGETAGASFDWVGERETLSARNLRTHIMPAGEEFSFDVDTRTPNVDGNDLPLDAQSWDSSLLHAPRNATLMLGGDLTFVFDGEAMADFLSRVDANKPIVIVSADGNPSAGQSLVTTYSNGLRTAGWDGEVDSIVYGDESQWRGPIARKINQAGGVIFVARDQSRLAPAIADDRFRGLLNQSLNTTPVVLTDWSMTAAMGEWYVANPEPSARQSRAIDAFRYGDADIQPGLGLLPGVALQPVHTLDQHWGRLYALTMERPETIAFGLSEDTAIVLDGNNDAHVVGDRSVIALDGQASTYAVGDNGAFGAFNVMLDAFGPGDAIAPSR